MTPRTKNSAALSFWIVGLTATALFAFATVKPTHAEAGQAFSISPPLIELKADPGQTVSTTIRFTNISSEELLIKTQFNDFSAKDEQGDPNIIFDETQTGVPSLKSWITSPAPFKITSKETKTLTFPITVPKDAEPGGHYAVIRFTGHAPDIEESGVALSASIGSLVLLEVSGNIKEQASLADFYTSANATKAGFFEGGPISFTERINNSGNVHVKPTGSIDVYDMFGRKVNSLRVNGDPTDPKNQPKSALPTAIRRFDQTLSDQWMFGQYTAKLHLAYGDSKKTLDQSITFWVIPYRLIIGILAGAVAAFFLLRWTLQRYNAYIIKQARRGRKLK